MTDAEIAMVRLLAHITEDELEDETIQAMFETAGSINGAVALVWRTTAAKLSRKVNVASGQTRLDLGQQFDHAVKMAEYFGDLAGDVGGDLAVMTSVRMHGAVDEEPMTEYTWPATGEWEGWL